MSKEEHHKLALSLVSDQKYQETRSAITTDVKECMDNIITAVSNRETKAASIFKDAYLKLKLSVVLLVLLVIGVSISLRQIIVKPLKKYGDTVKSGGTLPLEGAYELRQLAETYNDALTKAFNLVPFKWNPNSSSILFILKKSSYCL